MVFRSIILFYSVTYQEFFTGGKGLTFLFCSFSNYIYRLLAVIFSDRRWANPSFPSSPLNTWTSCSTLTGAHVALWPTKSGAWCCSWNGSCRTPVDRGRARSFLASVVHVKPMWVFLPPSKIPQRRCYGKLCQRRTEVVVVVSNDISSHSAVSGARLLLLVPSPDWASSEPRVFSQWLSWWGK